MKKGGRRHRPAKYMKHKPTKHRTLEVPDGFDFLQAEKHPHDPKRVRVVFKKKR